MKYADVNYPCKDGLNMSSPATLFTGFLQIYWSSFKILDCGKGKTDY
jgi:hypothetical protein